MSYLTSIGTKSPDFTYSLNEFIDWSVDTHTSKIAARKIRFLASYAGISSKRMMLNDFHKTKSGSLYRWDWDTKRYMNPSTAERLSLFIPLAGKLGEQAANNCLEKRGISPSQITHLIAVSCTGMCAPGLEIDLFKRLNLSNHCERSAVNFMGCYAAFHAFKQAKYICEAQPNSKVLIVSVELCSLHYRNDERNDNLLSTVLFSDGAAAALMEGIAPQNKSYLLWKAFHSVLIEEGEKDMGWLVGNEGFEMTLSSTIPKHIKTHVQSAFLDTLKRARVEANDIIGYAIHPGGKNILSAFIESLDCTEEDLQNAYDVLDEYGNMSSATILFVLERILGKGKPGKYYSAAFGPGLTVEGGVFTHSL